MSHINNLSLFLKDWVTYDNYLKKVNKKTKDIKEKKEKLESKILTIFEHNNMTNTKVNIGDSKIFYNESISTTSLSYKFLFECLHKYFNNEKKAEEICDFIKSERDKTKKINYSIKRTMNKQSEL